MHRSFTHNNKISADNNSGRCIWMSYLTTGKQSCIYATVHMCFQRHCFTYIPRYGVNYKITKTQVLHGSGNLATCMQRVVSLWHANACYDDALQSEAHALPPWLRWFHTCMSGCSRQAGEWWSCLPGGIWGAEQHTWHGAVCWRGG